MKKEFDYDDYDLEETDIENEFLTPKEVMNLLYIGKNTFSTPASSRPSGWGNFGECGRRIFLPLWADNITLGGWTDGQI